MIKKISTLKNILFPRVYAPWEQPGITDLSSAELQELIALIDAHLAEFIPLMAKSEEHILTISAWDWQKIFLPAPRRL